MIVVGGENVVDLVPAGEGRLLDPALGGGPYNASLAAARLGAPSAYLSRLSTDHFGVELVERLADSGVRTDLLQRGPEPTTLAVVALGADGTASYSFYVAGTADRAFTDPGPLPAEVTAVSVGALGMVLEPGASAYEAVLRRENARGVLTVLDPSIRPQLITDPDAYRRRFASWLPSVGLLKVSADDATWLVGESGTTVVEAVRQWAAAGPAAVVLTSGADGLGVLTAEGLQVHVPATPATVVDTIGAGDTVQGAILAWLDAHGVRDRNAVTTLSESDWREVLEYAGKAAAITVSRTGAEPPYAAELV